MEDGLVSLERGAIEARRPAFLHDTREIRVITRPFRLGQISRDSFCLLDHLVSVQFLELLSRANEGRVLLAELHNV